MFFDFKSSCIASHLHYNTISCIVDVRLLCWNECVLVGLDWAEPMMFLQLHITCSCIFMHTYLTFSILLYIDCVWCFYVCMCVCVCVCLSLSLSLSISLFLSLLFTLVASWHLNVNLLHPGTLYVSRHPLLLILLLHMFGSAMIKQIGLFEVLDEPFIRNAKSFCRTSPTLTYPLSFTIGVGSHCVTAQ